MAKAGQVVPEEMTSPRDVAREQASSTVFSRPREKTPGGLSSEAVQALLGRGFSASDTCGEEEGTASRSALQAGHRDAASSFGGTSRGSRLSDQLKAQRHELRSKIGELELRAQGQEQEPKGQVNTWEELQLELEKAKMELDEKEKVSTERREALVRMTAQCAQASTKCSLSENTVDSEILHGTGWQFEGGPAEGAAGPFVSTTAFGFFPTDCQRAAIVVHCGVLEEKLKKLSEDLSCQRQDADSVRCSLEEKLKVKEKAFQEVRCMDRRGFVGGVPVSSFETRSRVSSFGKFS
ncbi:centromere protein F-like [Pteronotus mesoamericanus]|uniref:centromere protein F-like n=1 Tax=Pteronotus mesoamericanus TaxID=1884717 RepID=UPI0023EE02C3|nr:centromere protein F-like [Pteronotus parnellii mesoamericanus]